MAMRRWLRISLWIVVVLALLVAAAAGYLYWRFRTSDLDSGGPIRPAQAAFDVQRYDLEVAVDPATRSISGRNLTTVLATAALDRFELQLDDRMKVSAAQVDGTAATFVHDDGLITVALATPWVAGERHAVEIAYAGVPKVSRNPPWNDGFVWEETPSGRPFVGVTSQGDGGDDWWPCKDHPSDEPDEGMTIALTVPGDLVGLTNGRKVSETTNADGTVTTRWNVSYPINNYLVTVNIAPYVPIEEKYHGVDGTLDETILFWALPEHEEQARTMWKQAPKMLEVHGRRFGEYPFFRDKYWVVETPYLGMEHQTIVAYGAKFKDTEYGFDSLLLHETAHEWWGNKITARDWGDFWLHEGFGTYAEGVFVNDTLGVDKYLEYAARWRRHIRNRKPIVQGRDITAGQAYIGDIYSKGALVLHTLRYLMGDDEFFAAIHDFANDERFAYRLSSTADFTGLVEARLGRAIPWFWQRYLYSAKLPTYRVTRTAGGPAEQAAPEASGEIERVVIEWSDPTFAMPLPVRVGEEIRRVEMAGGRAEIVVAPGTEVEVDPQGWVLAEAAEK
ncbi:MAG: M1 family metallopeptidase [Thermoanaerobaculia bacterium]